MLLDVQSHYKFNVIFHDVIAECLISHILSTYGGLQLISPQYISFSFKQDCQFAVGFVPFDGAFSGFVFIKYISAPHGRGAAHHRHTTCR